MNAFRVAVADLPTHYRTVFELCVQEGVPYQEAGRRLGMPTGTVAIRIMRARKRLFGALQNHLGRLRRPPASAALGAETSAQTALTTRSRNK